MPNTQFPMPIYVAQFPMLYEHASNYPNYFSITNKFASYVTIPSSIECINLSKDTL